MRRNGRSEPAIRRAGAAPKYGAWAVGEDAALFIRLRCRDRSPMVRSVPRSFVGRGRSSHTAGTSVVSEGRSRSRLSSADTPGSGSPKNVAVRLCWSRNASRRSRSASANGQGVKLGMIFLGIVSPVWSPHNAAQGHTRALAKQWRQTVRIETIAGPVRAHRKPLSGFVNRRSLVRMRHPAPWRPAATRESALGWISS